MVFEQQDRHDPQRAAITAFAEMTGCHHETLRNGVRQAESDQGLRPGVSTDKRERLK
jgi:transposase